MRILLIKGFPCGPDRGVNSFIFFSGVATRVTTFFLIPPFMVSVHSSRHIRNIMVLTRSRAAAQFVPMRSSIRRGRRGQANRTHMPVGNRTPSRSGRSNARLSTEDQIIQNIIARNTAIHGSLDELDRRISTASTAVACVQQLLGTGLVRVEINPTTNSTAYRIDETRLNELSRLIVGESGASVAAPPSDPPHAVDLVLNYPIDPTGGTNHMPTEADCIITICRKDEPTYVAYTRNAEGEFVVSRSGFPGRERVEALFNATGMTESGVGVQ